MSLKYAEENEEEVMTIRVLVIDDEEDIRRLVQIKLSKAGYDVTTASDGEEGVALALKIRPDVVIADIMMPGKDGYQVVTELKGQLAFEPPVLILLTAKNQKADIIHGLAGGADDYVTKPFSPRELIERIEVALIKAGKTSPGS
ncbi:MAG: response regulator transcription factor [Proteobacteria bacterium]|nr:response regulator transcription factor [Pseudomonadota bacterium]MBU1058258.1 response regulator transcription factor [Pseudomonadota bacterium]